MVKNPEQYKAKLNDLNAIFDVRGFLVKLLRFWPVFLISLGIAYSYAYYISVRQLPVYYMENSISIKDDQNPFFTTNTSLTFNWGGTTDKVNTALVTLRSRTHAEKVVDELGYFVSIQKDGTYQRVDAYGSVPFEIEIDRNHPQVLNILKGDMNIIGPRPERPEFVKGLSEKIPFYDVRHVIKPGLTGWAQVNHNYGTSHDDALIKLQYDLYYIKNRSLFLDLSIYIKTLTTVLFLRGQ